ncbi:MAG: type VI secretion system tip protein VgrG [Acidobacteria bacterium]|nr:MAG: type VI secretion system tip protein VgrG [Acidobacteriota bacterium]REJ98973.1 MAG: type VI secretion system tip protein VgrG [Acidobacteriota bacterium]REK16307.1 MAG: type VI secretion system tip protein VgrG [Acidobacteriota bacterium]REK43988.1 MAG: type VI secretion system tip protein VgrG [Acidobacteriota bacterium]
MPKATQENRLLSIATKLPYDTLLIDYFECREALSELFEIKVELLKEEDHEDRFKFTALSMDQLLGQRASIKIEQEDGGKRHFTGIFKDFRLVGRQHTYTRYEATIVPNIWRLTKIFRSRIFQHMSVPDILNEVFDGYETKFQLQNTYHQRNICVQYQETDFAFVSRVMEEEGIYYYFEHSSDTERVIFRDNYKTPEDCPEKSRIGMIDINQRNEGIWESSVKEMSVKNQLDSGKYVFWDRNFQLTNQRLNVERKSRFNIGGNQKLEVYEFPGGYAQRFDGIDRGGGEQSSELQKIFEDNKRTAEVAVLASDSKHSQMLAASDCSTLAPGYRFNLEKHPNAEINGAYILTNVVHRCSQNPSYVIGDETKRIDYDNEFVAIPHGEGHPEFRPERKTPKPVIHGTQTGVVVGPAGEEIFTDKYGRVKVQLFWDRDGQFDSDSYCWMRVSQSWASNKWGSMFIPRIGMEVVVSFIGGDPNAPLITGCVYNPETMPPYDLPDNKTRSVIRTDSTPGGGGFNELRFEDKAGEEQIFVHGEKDLDVRIKNDTKVTTGNDQHVVIGNDSRMNVGKDMNLVVGSDKMEDVTGTTSRKSGMDVQEEVGMNYALDAGMEAHIKGGMNVVIDAGLSLTLKVGGNFINIGPGGIFIQGTMVNINSGGAAGSGTACNPAAPTDALEADNSEAGQSVQQQRQLPPPEPTTPGPLAAAIWEAAQNGTPFVGA